MPAKVRAYPPSTARLDEPRALIICCSFYPLFPVPADLSAEVNLDVTHSDGLRLDQSAHQHAPDVLLLPSKLKQFTKVRSTSVPQPEIELIGFRSWSMGRGP